MTDLPDPMSRVEAIVTRHQEMRASELAGDERRAGAWRQSLADLIDPPGVDPNSPDTIMPGPVSYEGREHDGPAPRSSVTAAELAEVYAELSARASENGDRERAEAFEAARQRSATPTRSSRNGCANCSSMSGQAGPSPTRR